MAGILIAVAGAVATTAWQSRPKHPSLTTAQAVVRLHQAAGDLDEHISQQQPESDTTSTYLRTMRTMSKDCSAIIALSGQIERDGAISQRDTDQAVASANICKDVIRLTDDSVTAYQALAPVLGIHTTLRFYQTMPFISDVVRRDHLAKIAQVKENDVAFSGNKDFPSSLPELLKSLKITTKNSQGLDYLPALASFQAQAYAERQQYWSSYASLSDLRRELDSQISAYCQLSAVKGNLSDCE